MDASHCSDDDSPYDLSILLEASSGDAALDGATLDEATLDEPDLNRILDAIRFTLNRHRQSSGSVSVRLVSDDVIAELHQRCMGIAGPTDVLTFDLSDDPQRGSASSDADIHADIVISIETAAREARDRGHRSVHEVMLYAIHATLHLLGFDDHEEAAATRMHAEEDDVLTALGVGPVFGRTSE
ncbi:MAG: rRNA maturation RNase YbeY [Planctomycetes bacterium]|nr:rRNA maturation RNase YbeY [Planctomycetota bacterium]